MTAQRTVQCAVIGCKLKLNANEGCNSCASLAWLVLSLLYVLFYFVMAPLVTITLLALPSGSIVLLFLCLFTNFNSDTYVSNFRGNNRRRFFSCNYSKCTWSHWSTASPMMGPTGVVNTQPACRSHRYADCSIEMWRKLVPINDESNGIFRSNNSRNNIASSEITRFTFISFTSAHVGHI